MRNFRFIIALTAAAAFISLSSCKKCLRCTCKNYYDFQWDKNWEGTFTEEERYAEQQKVITRLNKDYPEIRKEACGKKSDLETMESDWIKQTTQVKKDQAIFDYTMDHSCICVEN